MKRCEDWPRVSNDFNENLMKICKKLKKNANFKQAGRQAAILNDTKNLFDFLGANFQTNWPIHFWEIADHGRTDFHWKM